MTSAALALSPATRRQVRYVLVAAAVLGAIIGADTLVLHLTLDPLADVRAYYDAGARLNAGQPLYVQPATTDDPSFYRYPPLLAILFRPLALLPFEVAASLWAALLMGLFALTVWRLGVRAPSTWILLGLLAPFIAWALAIGQAEVVVTFLLTLAAPWAVALAGQLKLFPALAAVYWLGRRDTRRLRRFAVVSALLIAVQLALAPAATLDFVRTLSLEQVGAVNNRSLYAVSPVLWAAVVAAAALLAWRLAPTRHGRLAAIVLTLVATPRLLLYQLMTLLAARRSGDATTSGAS